MRFYFFILFAMFLSSCKPQTDNKANPILEIDKMKVILMEIHISDAIAEQKANGNRELEKSIANKGFKQILKNHAISEKDFNTSFKFYQNKPEIVNKMYAEIIEELSKRQAQVSQ